MLKLSYHTTTWRKETISLMNKSITQDIAYRQSLMKYAEKYGVSRASRKYNKSRSYIYFWKQRWDGSAASLACQSRRPHSHPNQHTEAERKLIRDMRRRNPTPGMIKLRHIPCAITAKSSAAIARTGNASIPAIPSILWTISQSSLRSTIAVPTTCP